MFFSMRAARYPISHGDVTGHFTFVEEWTAHALHQASGRGERELVGRKLCRPRGVGHELQAEWGEPAWPVEVDEPEALTRPAFENGTDFMRSHGLSRCSGFHPGYQPSRN